MERTCYYTSVLAANTSKINLFIINKSIFSNLRNGDLELYLFASIQFIWNYQLAYSMQTLALYGCRENLYFP